MSLLLETEECPICPRLILIHETVSTVKMYGRAGAASVSEHMFLSPCITCVSYHIHQLITGRLPERNPKADDVSRPRMGSWSSDFPEKEKREKYKFFWQTPRVKDGTPSLLIKYVCDIICP